ncbi:MAG: UDP-N-acetylmuramoyl-L-alanine--D-glutamate ligase, partial [Gammaproteobacteria bacterium]
MKGVHSNELTKKLKETVGIGAEEARVLIVGLGDTGFSVARFFHRNKIQFAVTDSRERPPL